MSIATIHTPEMVRFYNTLFGAQLQATEVHGSTLYHGTLAGIQLIMHPDEIGGVNGEESRHQLSLRVPDLSGLLEIVEIAGGSIETPAVESVVSAILRDPDDNTIELIQA
jgi:predicted enzyme related to lactoylglutathione lyase